MNISKTIIEVTRKPYQYDITMSNVENEEYNKIYACSREEFDDFKSDICRAILALNLSRQIFTQDLIDIFLIQGYIDDDVLYMFEEMISTLTNDDVDKVDYSIWSIEDLDF